MYVKKIIDYHKRWLNGRRGEQPDYSGFDLSRCGLAKADFTQANFEKAKFCDTNLELVNFTQACLSHADFKYARIVKTCFEEADLSYACLSQTNACYADFSAANLKNAGLSYAGIWDTDFTGANLQDADLSRANLKRARLIKTNLCKCDLSEACLEGANLMGANLSSARLWKATGLPKAPVVENIHQRVFKEARKPGALDTSACHTAERIHSWEGWVITLAGNEGRMLEEELGSSVAAALIYQASDPKLERVPNWYAPYEVALADMQRLATKKK